MAHLRWYAERDAKNGYEHEAWIVRMLASAIKAGRHIQTAPKAQE